jgi:hypothetical protein
MRHHYAAMLAAPCMGLLQGTERSDRGSAATLLADRIANGEAFPGERVVRVLPDGRICGLLKMMFTTGLCVDLDEDAYAYRYCYATTREASVALAAWDGTGDPPGPWIKRKGLGGDVRGPGSPEV